MNNNIERRILAIFLLVLLVLVAVAMATVQNIQRSLASSDWVNHTHAVILEADSVLSSLEAGEALMHAYLVTDDARDRGASNVGYTEALEHLEIAKALTREEPAQNQKLKELEKLITNRVELARQAIQARQDSGLDGARKVLAADPGSESVRSIQDQIGGLKEAEDLLLHERDTASYLQAQTTRWTVFCGLGFNFLMLALVAWLVRDDLRARRRAAEVMAEANSSLEARVRERTAELAGANEGLQEENLERQWAVQTLEHQLRYSDLIINSMSDLIFVVSKALNITRLNPAVAHFTGHSAQELIGVGLPEMLHLEQTDPAGPPAGQHLMARVLKDGRELHEVRAHLDLKNGTKASVIMSLFPLRDRDKVVGGVVRMSACIAEPPPGRASAVRE